ncbi:MAG: nucleotidyltransferase domain-containing protein [Sulfolobales archaeon]
MLTPDARSRILKRAFNNISARDEMFKRFINRLCASDFVNEIYLVGSRARGDHYSSSDYDVVVVVEKEDVLDVAEKIAFLKREPISIDVIILKREDLEDPIYREMLKHKKKLC